MRLLTLVVAFLLIAPPTAIAQYATAPNLLVSPSNPAPGENVTVEITDCLPGGGPVDVLIDGVIVGQAELDANGNFVGDFPVPLEAGGSVQVQVTCNGEVLSAILNVETPDLPFQGDDDDDGGDQLPRTGSNGSVPLTQAGMALVGLGCALSVIAKRRQDAEAQPEPRHG